MEMKRIDLSTNHFIPQTNFPKEGVRFGGLLACLLACLLAFGQATLVVFRYSEYTPLSDPINPANIFVG